MKQVINRDSVADLRFKINMILAKELKALGLRASLGRITYNPGKELRAKLTVVEVNKDAEKPKGPKVLPKVGERWLFGGKTYLVVTDLGNEFIVSRPSRARSAMWCAKSGAMVARYRIKADRLMNEGEKL